MVDDGRSNDVCLEAETSWRTPTRVFDVQAPLPLGMGYDVVAGRPPIPLRARLGSLAEAAPPTGNCATAPRPASVGPMASQHRLDGCYRLSIATAATYLNWIAPQTLYARVAGSHIAVASMPHPYAVPVLLDSRTRLKLSPAMVRTVAVHGTHNVQAVAVPDRELAGASVTTCPSGTTDLLRASVQGGRGGRLLLMSAAAAAEALLTLIDGVSLNGSDT